MNVYGISISEADLQFLIPPDPHTGETLATLNTLSQDLPLPDSLRVRLITRNRGRQLAPTDFPWLASNVPVYSQRAFEALAPLLERHGRPFPLFADSGETFVGLRVDRVIDALDPHQSQLVLFRSSGRVMDIERHVFLPERIGDAAMFRLPEFDRAGWIYATQEYVDAVTATGLQEAAFDLLWTDAV